MNNNKKPVRNNPPHQITVEQKSFFSGPVPPPENLAHYEQICPGAAERILLMAEAEQNHRIKTDNEILELEKLNSKRTYAFQTRGQWFALISLFSIGGLGLTAFLLDYPKEGRDIVVTAMIGIIGLFLGRKVFGMIRNTRNASEKT